MIKTARDYLTRVDVDRVKDAIADMRDAHDLMHLVTCDLEMLLDKDLTGIDRTHVLHLLGRIDSIIDFIDIVGKNLEDRILFGRFGSDDNN